ncbi:MAG: helicase [Alphaproteobacteria bacterium]|nr:helicase [Alphaproteobacteria bacterium]
MSSFPLTDTAVRTDSRLHAMLGPTNTGKTHRALERMLAYNTGVIGFPLRLLARENYDKIVERVGKHKVALVTGEEKIIPRTAQYYLCTVEAMPIEQEFEFLAVDEIQLAEDPERGHIFTDRILRARGTLETMFMGSDTMRIVLASLVPGIEFESRERLSELSYTGYKKLTRLPKRAAIVAFSMDDVYQLADLIRRQRGGTAVVLGALSPRTRNAQVEMYQSGEVDFMVATDAIGMGLNMDIRHVALASTRKFDGRRPRGLKPAELAQIAGRAGRYMKEGTFGVTGRVSELDPDVVEAIENHKFESIREICWRNAALDYSSPKALLKSLERPSENPMLIKGRPSDDVETLQALCARDEVLGIASTPDMIRLLWDVCQIPDFRKTMSDAHQELIADIYTRLSYGQLDEDWVASQVARLDDTRGEVDSLMTRIAHIRTWTYIAYKPQWIRRFEYWQEKTRAIEDRLSDALHEALLLRFVDRRTAHLVKAMEEGRELLAGIRANGEVIVESHLIGHLQGFRFIPVADAAGADYKAVMSAARAALQSDVKRRVMSILTAKDEQFALDEAGNILFQEKHGSPLPGLPIAKIKKGDHILKPVVEVEETDLLNGSDRTAIAEKLKGWLEAHVAKVLEPLFVLQNETPENPLAGAVRGIAYQLHEALGILPRESLEDLIATLTPEDRAALRARKVKLGPILVFLPELNKPAAVRLRAKLWALWNDKPLPVEIPKDGAVSVKVDAGAIDKSLYQSIGYPVYGSRAIRIDMLDRVIVAIYDSANQGKFQAQHQMAEWLGVPIDDLYEILGAMGHKRIIAEAKPEEAVSEETTIETAVSEAVPEAAPVEELKSEEPVAEEAKPAAPAEKPALDWFFLKRGKANTKAAPRHFEKKKFENKKTDKPKGKFEGKKKHGDKSKKDSAPKVMSAPAKKVEESPFAILEQLKNKG